MREKCKCSVCKWLVALILTSMMNVAGAVCPVCFIAAGAGVGLSQYLNIDDLITGLWLGATLYAMLRITISWLTSFLQIESRFKVLFIALALSLLYYGGTLFALRCCGLLGHELNLIYGIDRLVAGIFVGTLISIIGDASYISFKRASGGHAWFPFQKVAMILVPLIVVSLIFWYKNW